MKTMATGKSHPHTRIAMIPDFQLVCNSETLYLYIEALCKEYNVVLPSGVTHAELDKAVRAHLPRNKGGVNQNGPSGLREIVRLNPELNEAKGKPRDVVERAIARTAPYRIEHADKHFQRIVEGTLARAVNYALVELYGAALEAIQYRYLLTCLRAGEKRGDPSSFVGALNHVLPHVASGAHVAQMMRMMSTGFSARKFVEIADEDYRSAMSYVVGSAIKCGSISWIVDAVNAHMHLTSTARSIYNTFYYRQNHVHLVRRVDRIEHHYPITFESTVADRKRFVTNITKVCLWNKTGTLLPSMRRAFLHPSVAERLRVVSRLKRLSLSDVMILWLSQFAARNPTWFEVMPPLPNLTGVRSVSQHSLDHDEFDTVVAQSVYHTPTRAYNDHKSRYEARDEIGSSVKAMLLECADEVAPHANPILLNLALHPDVEWLASGQFRVDLTFHMFASKSDSWLDVTMCAPEFEEMVMHFMHVGVSKRVKAHLARF